MLTHNAFQRRIWLDSHLDTHVRCNSKFGYGVPTMEPEELCQMAREIYSSKIYRDESWKWSLSRDLEVTISQINRWISGHTPVRRVHEYAMRYLHDMKTSMKVIVFKHQDWEPQKVREEMLKN